MKRQPQTPATVTGRKKLFLSTPSSPQAASPISEAPQQKWMELRLSQATARPSQRMRFSQGFHNNNKAVPKSTNISTESILNFSYKSLEIKNEDKSPIQIKNPIFRQNIKEKKPFYSSHKRSVISSTEKAAIKISIAPQNIFSCKTPSSPNRVSTPISIKNTLNEVARKLSPSRDHAFAITPKDKVFTRQDEINPLNAERENRGDFFLCRRASHGYEPSKFSNIHIRNNSVAHSPSEIIKVVDHGLLSENKNTEKIVIPIGSNNNENSPHRSGLGATPTGSTVEGSTGSFVKFNDTISQEREKLINYNKLCKNFAI